MLEKSEAQLQSCIEKIEAAYEYMLAYAAQGRKTEPPTSEGSNEPSIRTFLEGLLWGIEQLPEGFIQVVQTLNVDDQAKQQLERFKQTLSADANSASAVVGMVLNVPSLSSQVIDNLNASTHVRTLLTDIFILDEVLRLHQKNPDDQSL